MHPCESVATFLIVTKQLFLFWVLLSMVEKFGSEGALSHRKKKELAKKPPLKHFHLHLIGQRSLSLASRKMGKAQVLFSNISSVRWKERKDWEQLLNS